jgi:hypothetical protein
MSPNDFNKDHTVASGDESRRVPNDNTRVSMSEESVDFGLCNSNHVPEEAVFGNPVPAEIFRQTALVTAGTMSSGL